MAAWQQVVTPDGPTAQLWAENELSRVAYKSYENPLVQPIYWLLKQIEKLFLTSDSPASIPTPLLLLALVIAILIVLALILRPYVLKLQPQSKPVFSTEISVADLEAALADALTRKDWAGAIIARFRIIVKGLEKAGYIVNSPGLTAIEVAQESSNIVPLLSTPMYRAATIFNDIRYGGLPAVPELYEELEKAAESIAKQVATKADKK